MKIILASKSPRRKEILEGLGFDFEIFTADTDESSDETIPERLVELLARRKGEAAAKFFDKNVLIISADTVVSCEGRILGKPHSVSEAEEMLRLLSGRKHTVSSGLSLCFNGKTVTAHENTDVYFADMPENFVKKYSASKEPSDKAGAYAVQGMTSMWIERLDGCYFNVVGLPVRLLCRLMTELGIDPTEIVNFK